MCVVNNTNTLKSLGLMYPEFKVCCRIKHSIPEMLHYWKRRDQLMKQQQTSPWLHADVVSKLHVFVVAFHYVYNPRILLIGVKVCLILTILTRLFRSSPILVHAVDSFLSVGILMYNAVWFAWFCVLE